MQIPDRDPGNTACIIPFSPRKPDEKNVKVTTIAAIIAVTVLHNDDEIPEEKLMDLIEASGEAEILDAIDATDELEMDIFAQPSVTLTPGNDNFK